MICIDDLRRYRVQRYCHMVSDTNLGELRAFAERIGVPRHWFHRDHYDLRKNERERAVIAGATEASRKQVSEIVHRIYRHANRTPAG